MYVRFEEGLGSNHFKGDFQGLPTMGPPYGKRDPYYGTHIFRESNMAVGLGNSMGPSLGPMSLGVPENPTEA